jgi:hypothetical protein
MAGECVPLSVHSQVHSSGFVLDIAKEFLYFTIAVDAIAGSATEWPKQGMLTWKFRVAAGLIGDRLAVHNQVVQVYRCYFAVFCCYPAVNACCYSAEKRLISAV